jgi:hypothetical protein
MKFGLRNNIWGKKRMSGGRIECLTDQKSAGGGRTAPERGGEDTVNTNGKNRERRQRQEENCKNDAVIATRPSVRCQQIVRSASGEAAR